MSPASPTLSEMEFDKHDSAAAPPGLTHSAPALGATSTPSATADVPPLTVPSKIILKRATPSSPPSDHPCLRPTRTPGSEPAAKAAIASGQTQIGAKNIQIAVRGMTSIKGPRLSRFLPQEKREAFIGLLPGTVEETIVLVQRECPSLATFSQTEIALRIKFDGNSPEVVKGVMFRVLPEAWPEAISDVLPLVYVDAERAPAAAPAPAPAAAAKEIGATGGRLAACEMQEGEHRTALPPLPGGPAIAPSSVVAATSTGVGRESNGKTVKDRLAELDRRKQEGTALPPLPLPLSQEGPEAANELSWDELVRDGTMLGMRGWTDDLSQAREENKEENKLKEGESLI